MSEFVKRTLTGMVIVGAIVGSVLAGKLFFAALLCIVWICCCIEALRLYSLRTSPLYGILCILYITNGLGSLYLLYEYMGMYGILGFWVLIWILDIFAYITGSLWGQHKLFPKISPSKTWEGAIGGGVLAMLWGYVWKLWFLPDTGSWEWVLLSISVIVAGMAGDLLESAVKRKAGVKDSGKFLPGHGGMLDRFDSALLAAPVALIICFILNLFLDGILFA